jgi:type IV fimbrial biogenesis protein FimT
MIYQRAFTLIELIVVVAVAAILVSVGIPSFQNLINSNQLTSVTNEFVTALHYTRSEAIKRGATVTMCRRVFDDDNNPQCGVSGDGKGWEAGWLIFVNPSDAGQFNADDGETLLRVHDAIGFGTQLRGNSKVAEFVSYVGSGFSRPGSLVICNEKDVGRADLKSGSSAKVITISNTGRPAIKKITDTDITNCDP